jgi:hypothetical protein
MNYQPTITIEQKTSRWAWPLFRLASRLRSRRLMSVVLRYGFWLRVVPYGRWERMKFGPVDDYLRD